MPLGSDGVRLDALTAIVRPRNQAAFHRLTLKMDVLITEYAAKEQLRPERRGRPDEAETGRDDLIVKLAVLFHLCSARTHLKDYRSHLIEFIRAALLLHKIWRAPDRQRIFRILKAASRENLLGPS